MSSVERLCPVQLSREGTARGAGGCPMRGEKVRAPIFSKCVPNCPFPKLTDRDGEVGNIRGVIEGRCRRSDGAVTNTQIRALGVRQPFIFQAACDLGEQRPAAAGAGHDLTPAMAIA